MCVPSTLCNCRPSAEGEQVTGKKEHMNEARVHCLADCIVRELVVFATVVPMAP